MWVSNFTESETDFKNFVNSF